MLSLSSLSSLGGFTALLSYPLAGASMQMFDLATSGLGALMATLAQGRVTLLRGAPSLLRGLARLSGAAAALAGLRVVQSYGEPLLKDDAALLRTVLPASCFLRTTYGSTEASGLSWFAHVDDAQDPLRLPGGILMPDTEARIVDPDGKDCARGEAGELVIRSRYNALGEWQDGGTRARAAAAGSGSARHPHLRDGRPRALRPDDVFVILGRADRMLNINGVRVEPAEIERALAALPGVERAEVMVQARGSVQSLIGFLMPTPGAELDTASLKASLRDVLTPTMMPARLIVVPEMPLLPGGKVDGRALLALAA